MIRRLKQLARDERGAAIIELALAAPERVVRFPVLLDLRCEGDRLLLQLGHRPKPQIRICQRQALLRGHDVSVQRAHFEKGFAVHVACEAVERISAE